MQLFAIIKALLNIKHLEEHMKKSVFLAVCLGVILVTYPLQAKPHHEKMGPSIEKMTKQLDLGPAQVDQIETINSRFKTRHEEVADKLKPLKGQLREYTHTDAKPDYVSIQKVLEDMAPHRVEMHMLRIKHKHRILSVLTPTQKEKFKKAHKKRKDRAKKRDK